MIKLAFGPKFCVVSITSVIYKIYLGLLLLAHGLRLCGVWGSES